MNSMIARPDRGAPLRIAMFSDSFYPELGGIQDSIMASARELGRRGNKVLIVAPGAAAGDFAKVGAEVAEIELGANVTIHRLFAVPVPGSTGQSRLALPFAPVHQKIAAFAPDIIHTHTFLGTGLAARAVSRRLGVPLLGSNHWAVAGFSLYAPFAKAALSRFACAMVARYYNHCLWTSVPSHATLGEMRAHGFSGAAGVISNPIDTAGFAPVASDQREILRREWGFSGPTLVYAGRLGREKHIDVLIRAMPVVCQTQPDATLVLAGHGTTRPALEGLARSLGVSARLRFVGTLNHGGLARLFQAADVFGLASTSESQGMALLQAMSCGLPAIGARHGPLIEYIPADAGLLAEPGNPDDFACQLSRLLADAALRQRMGQKAARWARRYAVSAIADSWTATYQRVANGDPRPAFEPDWTPSCA